MAQRDLPWRRTRDPWAILVSEIMLQQTRVQAVIPYYAKFLQRFPTPEALAQASESAVLAQWSGLGYYSRARRLQQAARAMRGRFPRTYTALSALPGIGPYTAAAVASIAFEESHAAVDGNVLRVIARVKNDASAIDAGATKRRFQSIADAWLDPGQPGAFNQAMMELGATVCLPRAPLCEGCPLSSPCQARAAGTQGQLPVKLGRVKPEAVRAEVVVARKPGYLLLGQRAAGERRMAGFWELPDTIEFPAGTPFQKVAELRHTIVNQLFTVSVLRAAPPRAPRGFRWIQEGELDSLPLTTITRKALASEVRAE